MRNHLSKGSARILHKDKNISTSLTSSDFEKFIESMDSFSFYNGSVPAGLEHRADLIANVVYGDPTLDWLICWFNHVSDPFQQLNAGDSIRIPKLI